MNSAALTAIDRKSLKDVAVEQIRRAITHGDLKPGERLTELGLAARLGVGQATIREALIELENQGFIERSGRQTAVTSLSRRDRDGIYQVRSALETLAVELIAAVRVRKIEFSERAYQRMLAAAERGDVLEFCSADLDFHRGLWQASGNRALAEVLERVVPRIFALDVLRPEKFDAGKLRENAKFHGGLLELLADGKWRAARALMKQSMRQAWKDDAALSAASES
jgi:DNA-binding GntR family transcriptional regulator